jgi:hypothetical protein
MLRKQGHRTVIVKDWSPNYIGRSFVRQQISCRQDTRHPPPVFSRRWLGHFMSSLQRVLLTPRDGV